MTGLTGRFGPSPKPVPRVKSEPRFSSLGRGRPLAWRSKTRKDEMAEYLIKREAFLVEHPVCEFPLGCVAPATEIQHTRGRNGARLLAVEWWKSSCHRHNMWAEDHTGEALACGWLIRINSTGDAA